MGALILARIMNSQIKSSFKIKGIIGAIKYDISTRVLLRVINFAFFGVWV